MVTNVIACLDLEDAAGEVAHTRWERTLVCHDVVSQLGCWNGAIVVQWTGKSTVRSEFLERK